MAWAPVLPGQAQPRVRSGVRPGAQGQVRVGVGTRDPERGAVPKPSRTPSLPGDNQLETTGTEARWDFGERSAPSWCASEDGACAGGPQNYMCTEAAGRRRREKLNFLSQASSQGLTADGRRGQIILLLPVLSSGGAGRGGSRPERANSDQLDTRREKPTAAAARPPPLPGTRPRGPTGSARVSATGASSEAPLSGLYCRDPGNMCLDGNLPLSAALAQKAYCSSDIKGE